MARIFVNETVSPAPKALHGVNLNDPLFAHLRRAGVGIQELTAGHNTTTKDNPMRDRVGKKDDGEVKKKGDNKHFIQKAIKHPGAERKAAARAGMSTHEYMEKHKHDPGTAGKRARLGLTLEKMHGGK